MNDTNKQSAHLDIDLSFEERTRMRGLTLIRSTTHYM